MRWMDGEGKDVHVRTGREGVGEKGAMEMRIMKMVADGERREGGGGDGGDGGDAAMW